MMLRHYVLSLPPEVTPSGRDFRPGSRGKLMGIDKIRRRPILLHGVLSSGSFPSMGSAFCYIIESPLNCALSEVLDHESTARTKRFALIIVLKVVHPLPISGHRRDVAPRNPSHIP
jgi:hypothetical protein